MEEVYNFQNSQAESWAPEIRTMPDGTQVQRTPDSGYDVTLDGTLSAYNTLYLNSDNRGCESCHTDGLADLVENHLSYTHFPIDYGLGTNIDVNDCVSCHDDIWRDTGYVPNDSFGSVIHGIHDRESFNGNCMSCHSATTDGTGMRLWDDAKYEQFAGVVSVEDVQGSFSYEQDTLGGYPEYTWFPTLQSVTDKTIGALSPAEHSQEDFDSWELNIAGSVDNPYTITLKEIVEEGPVETFTMSGQCVMNSFAGEYVTNMEVTGVPVSWLLEKAGVQDSATSFWGTGADGWGNAGAWNCRVLPIEDMDNVWVIWEINGEPLTDLSGYPVRIVTPGHAIDNGTRWLTDIVVGNEEVMIDDGGDLNMPNAAICNTYEGQIIEAGKEYQFEGFAEGAGRRIGAIEFSMDGGNTWTRYDTSDSDNTKWVYWHFGFTPEEPGAYVLCVRALDEQGQPTAEGSFDRIMVNAK